MTTPAPNLARPQVGRLTLRNGDRAVTISAGNMRILVLARHLTALIDDLETMEDNLVRD